MKLHFNSLLMTSIQMLKHVRRGNFLITNEFLPQFCEFVCNQFSDFCTHDKHPMSMLLVYVTLSNHVKLLCVHFDDGRNFKADGDRQG